MKKSHYFDDTIIREYDIRGVFNDTLFEKDATVLGNLFGIMIGQNNTVNIAYDGRLSSLTLKENLIQGFLEVGVNVNEIGLGPTPLLYFSCFELNSNSGIIVTGSHNPKNHNGFKIVYKNSPFFGENLLLLKKKAKNYSINKLRGLRKKVDLEDKYLKRLLKNFDQKKRIKVVWDAGNGSAGRIMKKLANKIEGEKIILFDEINGNFPNHHPDPSDSDNLIDCKKNILENNFDIGLAFDGDGDRLGVIDDLGRVISGDKILLLLAKELLKKKKIKVIADVKCSQVLFDEVKKLGGEIIMSQTGHSHIKNNLKKLKADLAGEMSGHIFFADNYYGFDDALYAAVKMLEIVNDNKKKLSELVDEIPVLYNTPEIRVECEDEVKFGIIKEVLNNIKNSNNELISIDGVRVNNEEGWWLLRASNTQPALVVRCESFTKDGLENQKKNVLRELKKTSYSFNDKIFG